MLLGFLLVTGLVGAMIAGAASEMTALPFSF
jgi:hypothetical protein